MGVLEVSLLWLSCYVAGQPTQSCWVQPALDLPYVVSPTMRPIRTGTSLDVVTSSKAAFAWDLSTGDTLYTYAAQEQRPIASLNKLASALAVRKLLSLETVIPIPAEVRQAQQRGAHVSLRVGEQARVDQLLSAGLIASANDAMVALAIAARGSEEEFVAYTNDMLLRLGIHHTQLANATGLAGGEQFSTAEDVRTIMDLVMRDDFLVMTLAQPGGKLTSQAGHVRNYTSTNELLATYVPVVAAKTGYTTQAGENLVLITQGADGQRIGSVILGSDNRFQDMKVLVEWIWRNYSWPKAP